MAKETTYEEIARDLKNRIYKPVYYLMGEESYYIDRISEYIAQTVLNENEKEFNQTILYGAGHSYHYQCRQALSYDV